MKTELTLVTPEMAKKWLSENTDNRPLRPNVVSTLFKAYERGEWKVTHQGIAFSPTGRLLDGQHRLSFIAELPSGKGVYMNVSYGVPEESFEALDLGVKRTMSDIYQVSTGLISCGRLAAKLFNSSTNDGLTNQFVKPFLDWIEPEYEKLVTFAPRNQRVWSSTPIRLAAIIQMKRGYDDHFIRLTYASLVNSQIEAMPHAARALLQQVMSGRVLSARSLDLFCRGLRVFDSTQTQRVAHIQVKDQAAILSEVRKFIAREMGMTLAADKKNPVETGQVVAKPSRQFTWKKTA